jgi:hypothetical protein
MMNDGDGQFTTDIEKGLKSLSGYSQKAFVPFDPSTRRTEATVEKEYRCLVCLLRCDLSKLYRCGE